MDQICAVKKYLEKDRKLYAAFINLDKTYDRIDWKSLWDLCRMYGVGDREYSTVR